MNIKKFKKLALIFGIAMYTGLGSTAVFAVHDEGIFELEGNAVESPGFPPEDWERLYDSGANTGGASLKFTGIVDDVPVNGVDDDIFTGGRKDIQPLSQWAHKSGSSPDKDEITNAYAAAYKNAAKELIIYFGADRISNKGDAFLGFWFFRKPVTLTAGGFDGEHTSATLVGGKYVGGDVLVLTNFPQGANASPEIRVDVWDDTCNKAASNDPQEGECDAKNLRLIKKTSALCGAGANDLVCAITNDENGPNDPTPSPWPYQSKNSDNADEFPYESIFEGGINITQLLGGEGCFSSFMAETRSSSSFTATLKDFVLKDFNLCSFAVDKKCRVVDLNPDNTFKIDYEIDVTNTGVGSFAAGETLKIVDQPSDSAQFTLEDTLGNFGDGSDLDADETITISGSYNSTLNGGDNVIESATISLGAGEPLPATNAPLSVACDPREFSPLLSIEKSCELSLVSVGGVIAVEKNYEVDVCNTGQVPLDVTLTDNKDLTLNEEFSLDYAKSCQAGDLEGKCDTGTSCVQYTEIEPGVFLFACQDDTTGEFIEAVPGGDGLCATRSGEYNPDEVPAGLELKLSDTANAKATSPAFVTPTNPTGDLGDLTLFGESATAMCQLCPTCEVCP